MEFEKTQQKWFLFYKNEFYLLTTNTQQQVGEGSGHAYGTQVHVAFAQEVRALGRADLHPEISYSLKESVKFGTTGSIRVDIVYGSIENPIGIFYLKTGSAKLTPGRILQIQSQLPIRDVPVFEVKP